MPSSVDTNQTQFNINVVKSETVFEEMKKQGLPPRQIFMTPDVAGNVNNLRTEVVYNKSSSDANLNLGIVSGIVSGGSTASIDFSKYEKAIITARLGANACVFEIDLTSETTTGGRYAGGGVANRYVSGENVGLICCFVQISSDKTTLYNLFSGIMYTMQNYTYTNADYYISKIEGVLKSPAMLYTGKELYEGNGVSIKDGVISSEHPIGSYHFCETGSENPAIKFGGTWIQIAVNVIIPLGSYAPIVSIDDPTNPNFSAITLNVFNSDKVTKTADGSLVISNGTVKRLGESIGSTTTANISLQANLSNANNKISGVDIWLREK